VGTITRLQGQRRRDRVSVFIDGEYAFSLALEVAATLHRGQDLAPDDIERLAARDEYTSALDHTLRYLSFRPRSRHELAVYLDKRDVPEGIRDDVLARLSELGLLDDPAFAEWWVRNRTQHQPRGALALRSELAVRGVAEHVIANAVADIDEEAMAVELAVSRAARYADLPRALFDRRLGGYLQRRGFRYDVVRIALSRAWQQVGDIGHQS
jgi:regulatory protein